MFNTTKSLFLFAASAVAAVACSESPTHVGSSRQAGPPYFSGATRTGGPLDVPEVRMDLPPEPRPWDTSDAALVAAVAAESGHAVVAIKEPDSGHALQSGIRAAVSAATVASGLDMLRAQGAQVLDFYDAVGAAHVQMDAALAPAVRANSLVDYVEPRQHGAILGIRTPLPSPAMVPAMSALPLGTPQTVPWGIQLVRAPEGFSVTTGTGVTIELIDTGHDQGHEDLPLVPNLNCSGAFGGCDDAFPIPHGSHVLGIWTARDNAVGVVGVAPGISSADVFVYGACSSSTGSCPTTEVTAGINAAIFTAKVINLSLSQPFDAAQSNAVAQAWNNDIVIVAAAGNNGGNTIIHPANYTNVIGVSGVQPDKSFASTSPCGGASSNWGSHVDLAAPFWALSTVPGAYQDETDGWCGTSMATPHVSGAAALVRAQNPTWTNQQVVDRLLSTALDLGPAGWDDHFGRGLVDAANALGVPPPPPPPPPSVTISGPTTVRPGDTCTWFANASGGTPPYITYAWTPLGANAPEFTYTNSGQSFTVSVRVTDAAGASGFDSHPVTVSSSARACFQ